MERFIYNLDDFSEFLSEQSVGSEAAKALTDYVWRLDNIRRNLQRRVELSEKIIGEYELNQRMIELDYEDE